MRTPQQSRHTRVAAVLAVTVLAVAPVLTACGQAAEQVAEQAAEQAIGGDVDVTEDGVTITDQDGNQMAAGENVTVPDTWPSEVPIWDDGTLSVVTVEKDGSASALWTSDIAPKDAADSYSATLESAGYTPTSENVINEMYVREYTGNGFTVSLNAIATDGTTSLMVAAKPE